MRIQNRTSNAGLFLLSLIATQIWASEETLEISELCKSSNNSGIKRVLNFILIDKSASAGEILCAQQLNKHSKEALLDATYSINKINDSSFREAQASIGSPIQPQFESASSDSPQIYNNVLEPNANITLPTLEGFQTVPQ